MDLWLTYNLSVFSPIYEKKNYIRIIISDATIIIISWRDFISA